METWIRVWGFGDSAASQDGTASQALSVRQSAKARDFRRLGNLSSKQRREGGREGKAEWGKTIKAKLLIPEIK